MRIRKNGGLWFIAIGRLRLSVCVVRRPVAKLTARTQQRPTVSYRGKARYPVPTTAIDAIRYGVMACNVGVD